METYSIDLQCIQCGHTTSHGSVPKGEFWIDHFPDGVTCGKCGITVPMTMDFSEELKGQTDTTFYSSFWLKSKIDKYKVFKGKKVLFHKSDALRDMSLKLVWCLCGEECFEWANLPKKCPKCYFDYTTHEPCVATILDGEENGTSYAMMEPDIDWVVRIAQKGTLSAAGE